MSSGVYGNRIPATFTPSEHADVFLSYRTNRSIPNAGFKKVETSKYLNVETDGVNQIGGLYQLKLPLDEFNKVGIYNIYIKPKEIKTTIQDVGVLFSYPEIRGLVLNTANISELPNGNDSLVGYKIEYYDSSGVKIPNLFRIITSNNRCEPTIQNNINTYRFNDNSTLSFLTVSPSSSTSARPLSLPYIGKPQDEVVISNTFFNPEMIEIEMTENDIESLYTSINGNQIRTLDNGLITTFDKNNNIISQTEHYVIKESATGTPVYEVKQNKNNIDFSQDYENITSRV